ncbi:MAG TPA: efflux RND transporter periplasmic adaptor subunit [bacterium]|nr:efflux RND transporter periplasmic adaptor subunit [bacterium]
MKKRILIFIGVLIAFLLLFRIILLIIGQKESEKQAGRPSVAVEAEHVQTGSIREVRQFTGSVFPYYQYVIAPKITGRVLSIDKRIGDSVRRDEILVRIDDAEYQQAVREAEANLRIAQATLREAMSQFELSRQDLDRIRSLQEKEIATASELETATTNFEAQQSRIQLARAQIEQREAALKSAQIRLGYTILKAPEPGYVGDRFLDEGALLAPNNPVLTIIGIDRVIIRAMIIERDYGRIQIGQEAAVRVDAFPGRVFIGKVARLAPMLRESSRNAQVEVDVDNDSLILKPGMFARVDAVIEQRESVRIVPSKAVVTRGDRKGVFLVDEAENIVRFHEVVTGIVTSEKTEIVSPALSGRVVTLGQHLLADGSPVILPRAEEIRERSEESESGEGEKEPLL